MQTVGKGKRREEISEEPEEIEMSEGEQQVVYQIRLSTEWIEGLMQRIQQSLISNTPLIMCEKDLNALEFMVLATSCVNPQDILIKIEEMKKERKNE